MLDQVYFQNEDRMKKVIAFIKQEFSNIRTGRASVKILDSVKVEIYNSFMPISQVASVSTPDARTILVQPWDKGSMDAIEKAIKKSDLGLNPVNDGNIIRISIPHLTEERRKDLIKHANKIAEEQKVAVRNVRRDTNEILKEKKKKSEISEDDNKKALDKVQIITDKYIKEIEDVTKTKEKEIMEI